MALTVRSRADQVLLQRDVGAGVEGEATIATAALALGAGQGVLLARLRVQEYREIGANRAVAEFQHLFCTGADHDPVHFTDWAAEQAIADCAADFVDLHVCSSTERRGYRRTRHAAPR
jgi:hypothetical protein